MTNNYKHIYNTEALMLLISNGMNNQKITTNINYKRLNYRGL